LAVWEEAVTVLKDWYVVLDDPDQEAGEEPELPEKPVRPTLPTDYDGPVLDDLSFIGGFGELTSSFMYTHVGESLGTLTPFPRKYFGLHGQGQSADEGYGFDFSKDIEGIGGAAKVCSKRYYSINLLPEEESQNVLN